MYILVMNINIDQLGPDNFPNLFTYISRPYQPTYGNMRPSITAVERIRKWDMYVYSYLEIEFVISGTLFGC